MQPMPVGFAGPSASFPSSSAIVGGCGMSQEQCGAWCAV
jgi:hypothetical protein